MSEACECPTRKALELAINTVECASIDLKEGPTKGQELPWYKSARAALAAPCPCEGLREQMASYRVTTEVLLGIEIPESEGPLEFALCLMRAVQDQRTEPRP